MSKIISYSLHDPVGACEEIISSFDRDALHAAEEAGLVIIATDEEGNRSKVSADDVVEPELDSKDYVFVQPVYVDTRTEATVAVFDAIEAIIDPQAAAQSSDTVDATANDPLEEFSAALKRLRALLPDE